MKKIKIDLFSCIILVIISTFVIGCDKKNNTADTGSEKQRSTAVMKKNNSNDNFKQSTLDISIALRMDTNELKNDELKEIVEDKEETLKNGVYGCISSIEGNYYVLINGVDYWYSNISFSIKDKLLTISYNTEYCKGLRSKQLFLIDTNNEESFNRVELINNGNKEVFKMLYQQ